VFVAFVTFLKFFFVNALSVAEGFGVALLLREHYWTLFRGLQRKEHLSESIERPVPEPPAVTESEESSIPSISAMESPEPALEPEIPVDSPPIDTNHHKVDEFDETLVPKGFKVETVLENMVTSGVSDPDPELVPDFSTTPQATDSFSVAADALEESDEDEFFSKALSFVSELQPTIDVVVEPSTEEGLNDLERIDGVSALAIEVLGKDFDFKSFSKTQWDDPEKSAAQQEFVEVIELGNDAYRTESTFLKDTGPIRESTSDQTINFLFPGEMIATAFLEQDRSTNLVFTTDSPSMLPGKKGVRR